jgi:hypothetical protein
MPIPSAEAQAAGRSHHPDGQQPALLSPQPVPYPSRSPRKQSKHIGRASWSGLVQSIFSPPARPPSSSSFLSRIRPRRRAKNALHNAACGIIVARAPVCATKQAENWNRFSSCSGTSAYRRPSAIWDASSDFGMPSTIPSGSSRGNPTTPDAGRLVGSNPVLRESSTGLDQIRAHALACGNATKESRDDLGLLCCYSRIGRSSFFNVPFNRSKLSLKYQQPTA